MSLLPFCFAFVRVSCLQPNAPGERRPTGTDWRMGKKLPLWAVRSTGLFGHDGAEEGRHTPLSPPMPAHEARLPATRNLAPIVVPRPSASALLYTPWGSLTPARRAWP